MRVAAIFVNYRTAELTFKAASALLPRLPPSTLPRILIVDNDSRDGSFDEISRLVREAELHDQISVVASPRNGGYGYGINFAVRTMIHAGIRPQYIYVLNSDAFVESGTIDRLLDFMDAHPRAGLAAGRVIDMQGNVEGAGFRFYGPLGELLAASKLGLFFSVWGKHSVPILPVPHEDQEVEWVPGTGMMIRSAVFDSGCWFDERIFLYFEEVDFARQLKASGWQVWTVKEAAIRHYGSISTGLHDVRLPWPEYWFDSRRYYLRKHHGSAFALACDGMASLGHAVYFMKRVLQGKPYDERPGMFGGMRRARIRSRLLQLREVSDPGLLGLWWEDWLVHGANVGSAGFWAVAIHRLGERIRRWPPVLRSFAGMLLIIPTSLIEYFWAIRISCGTPVGRRLRICRDNVRLEVESIGDDVTIHPYVTIGAEMHLISEKVPVRPSIGSSVEIESCATVLGGINVGDGSRILGNSLVMHDVPQHAVVVGVPAKTKGEAVKSQVRAVAPGGGDAPTIGQAGAPIGFWEQLIEDYRTYDRDLMEGGLWVTWVHRAAQRATEIPIAPVRWMLRGALLKLSRFFGRISGIRLAPETKLGRRVRIWHVGGISLNASQIGDDVHLRPGTTCDSHPGAQGGAGGWPSIGHGVDVGAGARIVGDISIGDGASVGANSLVLESVPPACAVLGVPGRLLPRRTSVRAEESSTEAVESTPGLGVSDQNPAGIGLLSLIAEDFRTNGSSLWAPGFWTLFFHRFGNYRMRFRFKVLRAPMTAIYLAGFVIVRLLTGIDLSYVVKVGRRVRFDRNGPMMIGAESLGDDVFLGHSVVIGVASRKKVQKKPVIGDRVVIGPRACIVGGVRIGSDSVIGANTVVPASVPPGSLVIGVPGRVMARAGNFAGTESRVQSNGPAILQSHQ